MKPLQLGVEGLINDDDHKLTKLEIYANLVSIFGKRIIKVDNQYILDNKIAFLVKNITYLGRDAGNDDFRPTKKRIQLPNYFIEYVEKNKRNNIKTYYLGIYSYGEEKDYIYVIYDTNKYIQKKSNNSAAHISIFDLLAAKERGYYFKVDKGGNNITALSKHNFFMYFTQEFNSIKELAQREYKIIEYIKTFWEQCPKDLNGIDCYRTLYKNGHPKTFEVEWVGFFYEYLFEKQLKEFETDLIEIYGDKKKGGIDFDLKINLGDNFYADLKADNLNYGIQGNKKETIDKIIDRDGHVWYIVASFSDVIMDKNMENKVLEEYNKLKLDYNSKQPISKHKPIKDSYKDKMKYSVKFKKFFILDINKNNKEYLKDYLQGKNSNGKTRTPKYQIGKLSIDEFKIFEYKI